MANLAGVRTTDLGTGSSYTTLKPEVYEAIFNYEPYQTPIQQFFMANKAAKRAVGNPKFELMEDVLCPRTVYVTSVSVSTTAATITAAADALDPLILGTMVLVPSTGEIGRVTTISSGGTTAVLTHIGTNGAGSWTLATNSVPEYYRIIGSSFAEYGIAATAVSTIATFPYNYTQIHKKAVSLSGTMAASVNYGGDGWANQRLKATKEFKLDLEDTWLYGQRGIAATASANHRYSGGLLDISGIGISDASQFTGTSTFCDETYFFNTYCKNLFAKGSNSKVLYCGAEALLAINDFQKVKQQTKGSEQEYGVDVTTIITPFGRAKLVWHPALDQGQYPYYCIGVDRDNYMRYAYLSGNGVNRDMQYQNDVGTNGYDGRTDQYLAEVGMDLAGGGQGVHRICYPGA